MAFNADKKRSKKNRQLVRWVAGTLYVCLMIVMLELICRVGNPLQFLKARSHFDNNAFYAKVREGFQDDLWEKKWVKYRPGSSLDIPLQNGTVYSIQINSHGFRTREFGPKGKGVIRIITIGGSTTIQGDSNDRTYPALLEKQLQERFPGKSIEVLNFGISGSQSHYWISRLDELLSFEPDMVIQYNAINDLSDARYYESFYENHEILAYLRRSHLYQFFYPPQPEEFTAAYERVVSRFIAMHDALSRHGIAYAVATFATPDPSTIDGSFEKYLDLIVKIRRGKGARYLKYKDYHRMIEAYNAYLQQQATAAQIPLVDLHRQIFEAQYFVDECHMNQLGIEKQAQAFLPVVASYIVSRSPE